MREQTSLLLVIIFLRRKFIAKLTLTTELDGWGGPQGVWKPPMKQRSFIVVRFPTNLSHGLVEASRGEVSATHSGNVTQFHVPLLHGTRFHGFAAALESSLTWSPGRLLSCRRQCLAVRV